MISAKEAREKAESMTNAGAKDLLSKCEHLIKTSVEAGLYNCTLSPSSSSFITAGVLLAVERTLKEAGYKVSISHGDQRDPGCTISISW